MKNCYLIGLVLIFSTCLSQSQKKSTDIAGSIGTRFDVIGFEKLIFFGEELIYSCQDTTNRSKLAKFFKDFKKVKRRSVFDNYEYKLLMNLMYSSIYEVKVENSQEIETKNYLLNLFQDFKKIDFTISDNLILEQIDEDKRGLLNGYDEGEVSKSYFLFFFYDPTRFKRVLLANNKEDDWDRIDIFLCNSARENEIPKDVRYVLLDRMIQRLLSQRLDKIVNKLKSDCDVSINLYD
jgi:hypothetical protein